jgi:hypothetical protein
MELNRFSVFFLLIGISVTLVSFAPSSIGMGGGGPLDPGGVQGGLYMFTGTVAVTIDVRDSHSISMYVLDWDDTLNFMQNREHGNSSPIIENHNITSYNGVIEVPFPGIYSLIIESEINETIYLDIDMYRVLPQSNIFIPGLVIALTSSMFILLDRVYFFQRKKSSE